MRERENKNESVRWCQHKAGPPHTCLEGPHTCRAPLWVLTREGSTLITHVIKILKQQGEAVRSPILSAGENIKNCPSWAILDMGFARDSRGIEWRGSEGAKL